MQFCFIFTRLYLMQPNSGTFTTILSAGWMKPRWRLKSQLWHRSKYGSGSRPQRWAEVSAGTMV